MSWFSDKYDLAKSLSENSYKSREDRKIIANKYGLTEIPEYSSQQTQVLLDPDGNPYIAHRGSKNILDFKDDILIGAGYGASTQRYKNAVALNKEIEEKYKKKPIHVGHSLGGYLASKTSSVDAPVYTVNSYGGFGFGLLEKFRKNPNEINYRAKNDFASAGMALHTDNKIVNIDINKNPVASHSLDNLPQNIN
jgi:hypothetical protein